MRVSLANYELRPLRGFDDYRAHVEELVSWMDEPDLVVFPELMTLEWLSFCPDEFKGNGVKEARWIAENSSTHVELMREVASRLSATVVGGSTFFSTDEATRHYCPIVSRDGFVRHQPKVKRTQFEIEDWDIQKSDGFDCEPPLGVLVCYDVEFPEAGRAFGEKGVQVIAVPTFTETPHGVHRVRTGCLARALENQVYVVAASLLGTLGREPVPQAIGTSGVFAPMVDPFPESGIIALCRETETVLNHTLDLHALEHCRQTGDVRNWADRDPSVWQ
ncbi:MAG: hypothetical protein KF812_12390 [Fimbriimonadaceae bacterium]|nr:hypothetical protein [Fimbriimonadaceae bacterium]